MSSDVKNKKQIEWYDNPDLITSLIIGLIVLIVILSQSFAINNELSVSAILSSILNHNIVYLLMCIYFVSLKTKIGKKYFDFLNIFMIILYMVTAITSVLTVFQSFGLSSLLCMALDLLTLIYLIHTFLRSTRMWKSLNLSKSPFNEISNNGYFGCCVVLAVTLLAVDLISTTSFDGTILSLMDALYTILFLRYIFLYGEFLNSKKIAVNNSGNFDQVKEKLVENVNDFVEEHQLDEKFDDVKEKVSDFVDDVKEKAIDIKEDITEKIEEAKLDEKFEVVKDNVKEFATDTLEELSDIKEEIQEKIEESNIDEKVNEVIESVKEKVIKTTKKVSSKPKEEITSRKKPVKKKKTNKKVNK